MRAPEPIEVVRIVATPAALDATDWPDGLIAARIAQDEILLLGGPPPEVPDPHALVEDDHGFSAVGLSTADLEDVAKLCAWEYPKRPGVAQGAVLGIPVRIVFPSDRSRDPILLVSTTLAAGFREEFP